MSKLLLKIIRKVGAFSYTLVLNRTSGVEGEGKNRSPLTSMDKQIYPVKGFGKWVNKIKKNVTELSHWADSV